MIFRRASVVLKSMTLFEGNDIRNLHIKIESATKSVLADVNICRQKDVLARFGVRTVLDVFFKEFVLCRRKLYLLYQTVADVRCGIKASELHFVIFHRHVLLDKVFDHRLGVMLFTATGEQNYCRREDK